MTEISENMEERDVSIKTDYGQYLNNQRVLSEKRTGRFWFEQENRYVKPFQIYGNLYYVGDSWVCVHIVDTGKGLLMFDAGNCGATAMLIQTIWEMGFNPADVKWMILSHGHVDHFGAVNFFKRMFDTKIYMGEPDVKMFQENPELAMIQESGNCTEKLFDIDVSIKEGDVLTFGNTEIEFHLVPGHTQGCIACFFDVTDGAEKKRVGYYGGFGFNTLQEEYLREIGDETLEARKQYHHSLASVREQKVDIFMGNHTVNVDLLNKRKYMTEHPGENPFIDSEAWKNYLDLKEKELSELEQA